MEIPHLLTEAEGQLDTSPHCQPAQETPLQQGGEGVCMHRLGKQELG